MGIRSKLFALTYDRQLAKVEKAGLGQLRQELIRRASGRVLEIGAGTGANLPLYSAAVESITLTEPEQPMIRRLERRVREHAPAATVLRAPAEDLPFEDDSFDTAVFTLVLCTVPDPAAALAEAARVLKPSGKLLFVEHVRAEDPGLARWQDRLEKPWRFLADGCHCNRDTVAAIEASGFAISEVEKGTLPKSPPLVRPLVHGSAVRAG